MSCLNDSRLQARRKAADAKVAASRVLKQHKETEAQLEQAQQELQQQRQEASQEREDHESQMIGLRETIRQVCRVPLRRCYRPLTEQVCSMQCRPSKCAALIATTFLQLNGLVQTMAYWRQVRGLHSLISCHTMHDVAVALCRSSRRLRLQLLPSARLQCSRVRSSR